MDFSLEEAMDFLIEMILSTELIYIAIFYLINCHKFYS